MPSGGPASPNEANGDRPFDSFALAAAGGALLIVIGLSAWVSDDAFVTLRTIDNALHGYGLRFNPIERVQAFTHPLWMMVLGVGVAITREAWITTMVIGALTSVAFLALMVGGATSRRGAALALCLLLASKAWVDFATSGLENPLENLLLAAFVIALSRDRPSLPALIGCASLLGLTRLDSLVLVAPALALAVWRSARTERLGLRGWAACGFAAWPLFAWHAFALVYYGALLPNTAPAKLGAGVPPAAQVEQAGHYLVAALRIDPTTLVAIALGCGVALTRRDARSASLAIGLVGHLLWVVVIGGDFMVGRFFVAPLVVAALVVARAPWRARTAGALAIGVLGLSLLFPHAPLRSGPAYVKAPPHEGVVDERGYYWEGLGLWGTPGLQPDHAFARDALEARGRPMAVKSVIGLYGYTAGPDHHVIDRLGLADPLLARLPATFSADRRIGHFRRHVPDGYASSILAARARLRDPEVQALSDALRTVTRGELFSMARLEAIVGLHTGAFPVDPIPHRYPDARRVALATWEGPMTVGVGGVVVEIGGAEATFALGPGAWTVVQERNGRVIDVARPIDRWTTHEAAETVAFLPARPSTLTVE